MTRARRNLSTRLAARHRARDPMRAFDALPPELRAWMHEAALPWSPRSARRIWERAVGQGLDAQAAREVLARAEARTLARERG
ncbi:MAG: DUF6525 family protein [Paracoccaceae bacterium]